MSEDDFRGYMKTMRSPFLQGGAVEKALRARLDMDIACVEVAKDDERLGSQEMMQKMRHVTGMRISNFRGLKNFSCDKFRPITVIGGKNNCGKSTVLEAICFSAQRTHGVIPGKLVWNRGESLGTKSLASLFYGAGDEGKIIVHSLFSDGSTRGLDLECTHRSAVEFGLDDAMAGGVNDHLPPTYIQRYYTNLGTNAVRRGAMMIAFLKGEYRCYPLDPQNVESEFVKVDGIATDDDWQCVFYQSQRRAGIPSVYAELFKTGAEKLLLPYLKAVDSRIVDLAYDGERLLVGVENGRLRLPLNVMGDGMIKVAEILSVLAVCPKNGVLCLDEIENGLHHSAMRAFWKALVCMAGERNVQLVVTTHNIELLKAIGEETDCQKTGDFVYLNLVRRENDEVIAFSYDHSELAHSLSVDLEVR